MLLTNKKTAIIGAGPVGLTLARLLQLHGADVTVYERDKDANSRIQGGTLDLHKDTGQCALRKAGLLENYYTLALPMGIIMTDERGETQYTKDVNADNQYDNPEINRNVLREMLLASLSSETVIWDSKCIELQVVDGKWLLNFENGMQETADLVIGANGGMSAVRSYLTDTQVEDTGTMIIQGDISHPSTHIPEFYQWCNGKRLMAAHNGNLIVVNPNNDGRLTYGVIYKLLETSNDRALSACQDADFIRKILLERFGDWDDKFKTLLLSTLSFSCHQTKVLPLKDRWKNERPLPITLIGDAAHLMPPFAGQGVNTGLQDALVLSEKLTQGMYNTLDAAITAYEAEMFSYARKAQLASLTNEIEMRHPDFSFKRWFQ